jgi:hypothetical protein
MTNKQSVDKLMMGPEPKPSGPFYHESDIRLMAFFNWYNYFYTVADAREWIVAWMKNNSYDKKEISAFAKIPDNKISMSSCSLARMANNGAVLNDKLTDKIKKTIATTKTIVKTEKTTTNVVNIADRTKEKASEIIAEIESKFDEFYANDYVNKDFSLYDFLRASDVKKVYGKFIVEYYGPLLNELNIVIAKKDKDLEEGYRYLSKKQLTEYLKFVKMIIDDTQRYVSNQTTRVVRKPINRKVKPVDNTKLVKSFKYLKEFNELKLVSVSPETVIGASVIWIYNVKTRKLSVLNSAADKPLTIRGSSVINYDETTSICKTLRKPEDTLQQVLNGTKTSLKKLMSSLSTKESTAVGRSNQDTIILRYFK